MFDQFQQVSNHNSIEPQPLDVLCGRGKDCFHHEGNHQFRILIAEHADTYKMAPTKKQKMQTISLVADIIIARGGRFLSHDNKHDTNDNNNNKNDSSTYCWIDGGKPMGKKKVGHAFRDALCGRVKCISCMMVDNCQKVALKTPKTTSTPTLLSNGYWSDDSTHSEESVSSSESSLLDAMPDDNRLLLEPTKDWMNQKMDADIEDDLLKFFFADIFR